MITYGVEKDQMSRVNNGQDRLEHHQLKLLDKSQQSGNSSSEKDDDDQVTGGQCIKSFLN